MKLTTTADIRNFLIDAMLKVSRGEMDAQQGKTVCRFAQQIYNTVKLEIDFAALHHVGKIDSVEPLALPDKRVGRLR